MQDDYLYALQQLREQLPDAVTDVFGTITNFVGGSAIIIAVAVVFWSVNKKDSYLIILSLVFGFYLSQFLKNIFCMYRPWITDTRLHVADIAAEGASGYSFPSVHSAVAVSVGGSSAALLKDRHRGWAVFLISVVLLVVFSRNFLGCHSFIDVLAGCATGVVGIILAKVLISWTDRHPEKDLVVSAVGIVVAIAVLVFCTLKSYPLDYDAAGVLLADPWEMQTDCYRLAGMLIAFFIAWPIERRVIDFSTDIPLSARVVRAIAGMVIVGVLYAVVLPLLTNVLDAHWYYFVKYFVLTMVIMVIYPACFVRFERWRKVTKKQG